MRKLFGYSFCHKAFFFLIEVKISTEKCASDEKGKKSNSGQKLKELNVTALGGSKENTSD